MRDRIIVKKELMPYGFHIALGKEKFNMRFAYNKLSDLFSVTLYRDGRLLCHAEPIVYGVPLFRDIYKAGWFPAIDIVPLDESGQEQAVTWDNFGVTVFLKFKTGSES